MSEPLSWDGIENDPAFSKNPNALLFFNNAGKVAAEGEAAKTHELEFVRFDRVEKPPFDTKGKTAVAFHFVDISDGTEKSKLVTVGQRFFHAMAASKPKPGDKIQISRVGAKATVQFFVNILNAPPFES